MNRAAGILVGVVLAGALLGAIWWFSLWPAGAPSGEQPTAESGASGVGEDKAAADNSAAEFPVPESANEHGPSEFGEEGAGDGTQAAAARPLPALEGSDDFMRSLLQRLFSSGAVDEWLKQKRVVERIVVTVNSMDGPSISLRFWPVRHIEGLPAIERNGDMLRWSEVNTERYRALVGILRAADPEAVAQAYFRSYPLFQQAYDSLGLEDAHFNDRLVEIIDHLLGAPEIEPGFRVKQPKVLYEFADPELESESWGRKLLMRMGPENAASVKDWLRELRKELVAGGSPAQSASAGP